MIAIPSVAIAAVPSATYTATPTRASAEKSTWNTILPMASSAITIAIANMIARSTCAAMNVHGRIGVPRSRFS